MGIIKSEPYKDDDGKTRVREFYENGTIIERIADEEIQPEPTPLSTEQAIMQTAINTEYMMSLMEVKS